MEEKIEYDEIINRVNNIEVKVDLDNIKEEYIYDSYNRITKSILKTNNKEFSIEYTYKDSQTILTNVLNTIAYRRNNVIQSSQSVIYDSIGNVASIGTIVNSNSYEYDGINRLIRENKRDFQETMVYNYDIGGNILSISKFDYTIDSECINPNTVITYTYDQNYKDRLITYKNEQVTYDENNNITSFDGYTLSYIKDKE